MAIQSSYSPLNENAGLELGQILFPDPTETALKRMNANTQAGILSLNQQKFKHETDEDTAFADDFEEYEKNPTAEGLGRLFAKHPKYAKPIEDYHTTLSAERQASEQTRRGNIVYAAAGGNWDLAAALQKREMDATVAGGGQVSPIDQQVYDDFKSSDAGRRRRAVAMTSWGTAAADPKTRNEVLQTLTKATAPELRNVGQGGGTEGVLAINPITLREESPAGPDGGLVHDQRQPTPTNAFDAAVAMGMDPKTLDPRLKTLQVAPGTAAPEDAGTGVAPAPPPVNPARVAAAGQAPAVPTGFDQVFDYSMVNEGGYADADRNGKPVNMGVNAGANPPETLAKYGIKSLKTMTRDQAKALYKGEYWDKSGAEYLAPNLQAPYFDAYIRRPALAKHLLDQSGHDPVKFAHLAADAFQKIAADDKDPRYRNAWTDRDAKAIKIAQAGAPQPLGNVGGAPVVATPEGLRTKGGGDTGLPVAQDGHHWVIPPVPKPQTRDIPPDEVKARGLDPGKSWQEQPDGRAIAIGDAPQGADPLKEFGIAPDEIGPSVLTKLPANIASQVKALSEGRLPMPSSFALAKPYWQKMLQLTAQYDPTFDAATAPARKAAILAFTGQGKGAQVVGSVNRAANHFDILRRINGKLTGPSTGFGPLDSALAAAGQSFEPADAKSWDTAVGFIGGELEKIARNSPGSVTGVERVIKDLDRHAAKPTRDAALKTAVEIIAGAVEPFKNSYNSAFTNDSTRPKIPWVTKRAKEIYKNLGVDFNLTEGGEGGGEATTPQIPKGATVLGTSNGQTVILLKGKRKVLAPE